MSGVTKWHLQMTTEQRYQLLTKKLHTHTHLHTCTYTHIDFTTLSMRTGSKKKATYSYWEKKIKEARE